jgi:putative oxidoreductase
VDLPRIAGRAAIAAVFIHGGGCTLQDLEPRVQAAAPLLGRLRKRLRFLPGDKALVRATATVHVAAGLLLATGAFQRTASGVLFLSLVPTTIAGHPFWEISDPRQREMEMIQAIKNVGLGGALLVLLGPAASAPDAGRR